MNQLQVEVSICEWEAVVKSDGMQKQCMAIRSGLCCCLSFRGILQGKLSDGQAKMARLNGIARASNHFRNRSKTYARYCRPKTKTASPRLSMALMALRDVGTDEAWSRR